MHLKSILLLPVLFVAFAALACGGGGSTGGADEQQAGAAANRHIKTVLGLFDGSTTSQQLLNAFAPECRTNVKTSDLDKVAGLLRAFAPDLSKAKIEDVDLGKLDFEKTADGINVSAHDSAGVRIKTGGKWLSSKDYFALAGLDQSEAGVTADAPTLMVKRDGGWYIGDCTLLADFSIPS